MAEDVPSTAPTASGKEPCRDTLTTSLLQHFEKQIFTDTTISVRVLNGESQPNKRAKADDGAAAQSVCIRDIQAHAIILSSKSAYFSRAIQGGWKESSDRKIHIEVENDEDFEALHRLVKLSYCSSYAREGERRLEADELMQLIRMANAFEFTEAVKECAAALQEGMDWGRAVRCMELAVALSEVEELKGLRAAAQDCLAMEAGMVHELFTPAESDAHNDPCVLGGLRLSNKIAALSIDAFEAMLTSPKLCCKSKDDVFWLVKAWLRAQGVGEAGSVERQGLVSRLAKAMLPHIGGMTPTYVLTMVATDPIIIEAGLVSTVLADALGREVQSRRTASALDAAAKNPVSWTVKSCFTADDIVKAATDGKVGKRVGVLAGYPWRIKLERRGQGGGEEGGSGQQQQQQQQQQVVGIYTCPIMKTPGPSAHNHGGYFRYKLRAACGQPVAILRGTAQEAIWFPAGGMKGRHDFFNGKTWEEVFAPGSPYLTGDGNLEVEVTIMQ